MEYWCSWWFFHWVSIEIPREIPFSLFLSLCGEVEGTSLVGSQFICPALPSAACFTAIKPQNSKPVQTECETRFFNEVIFDMHQMIFCDVNKQVFWWDNVDILALHRDLWYIRETRTIEVDMSPLGMIKSGNCKLKPGWLFWKQRLKAVMQ